MAVRLLDVLLLCGPGFFFLEYRLLDRIVFPFEALLLSDTIFPKGFLLLAVVPNDDNEMDEK